MDNKSFEIMDNKSFHAPEDLGFFDLAISQTAQSLVFDFQNNPLIITHKYGTIKKPHGFGAAPTIAAGAKVVIYSDENPHDIQVITTYTVGSGITLSNADQTATITMNGVTFTANKGKTLKAQVSLINTGDIEYTFRLGIVDSKL